MCVFRGSIKSRHSFDPEIAGRVGLNAAVIFQNITFWIEKNQANRRNLRDGRYWTYNSISAFGQLFPYLSEKQIRTALEKLVSAELIIKGNFSDDRYDRTCWYALGNSEPPPLNWSTTMFRKRRTRNGKQATEARRDRYKVTPS